MKLTDLEVLQKRYDEAIQEIAHLRRILHLVNEGLSTHAGSAASNEQIEPEITVHHYCDTKGRSNIADRGYILELATFLFHAGITPSSKIFDEKAYLCENADVAAAIARSGFGSGFEHWLAHGLSEGRLAISRTVSNSNLGHEVISGYRSYKMKKAKKTKFPLNVLHRLLSRLNSRQMERSAK